MREQCGWVPAVGKDNKPQATPLEERAPPAVPDLSGTRGWSHGGQFFHGQSGGWGDWRQSQALKGAELPSPLCCSPPALQPAGSLTGHRLWNMVTLVTH